MATMTLINAINDGLRAEMERDKNVIVLGEDVGVNGGVFRATADLYQNFGEKRSFDTPLAESAIIGTAIGLANHGFRPVPEIQFAGFIYECMDQISTQAARIRMRSGGRFTAPITVRIPYGGGVKTPEMHSDSLEALFLHSPGVKVVVPSNPYDAKGLLIAAIREDDPVIFYEPMKLYRSIKADVPEEAYTVEIGKANIVREGSDVTILAYGTMVHTAEKAADLAEKERGVKAEVIDLRTISPFDLDTIISSVKKTHRAVIVHEAAQTGGVGAELATRINEEAILSLEAPVVRVAGFDTPYPLTAIEDEYLPTPERIAAGIYKTLDF
ncbi:alpha-ketoacid dehydrogenase subunit beta [Marininema halotolerans]|uniref:Pyruvate dehydrogenase E1 component beta subunit n=1 Tax=Marininema halotolerans TaxID=1155944 RepID=A0A1I6SL30_9BACL|nr:alpha-ketoacid dehydrogenase subunit beta [Marininema halotolerans]SFS77478.1 pyruvate dehydrogenase E1 component beta subunit [Marininema halotolerans]